jgi:hypothetical protein
VEKTQEAATVSLLFLPVEATQRLQPMFRVSMVAGCLFQQDKKFIPVFLTRPSSDELNQSYRLF